MPIRARAVMEKRAAKQCTFSDNKRELNTEIHILIDEHKETVFPENGLLEDTRFQRS